jgi:formylglycine-generating enzyme required for sulfatase activity
MKNIFKFLAIFAIIGTIVIIGCKEDDPPPPIGISLNKVTLKLIKGNQETLTATVTNTSNTAVSWSSSDTTKVTVANGVVTAVNYGTTIITATTVDGGKTATCTVTVPEISISLNKDSFFLFKDDQETLTATVTNTGNTAVSWSSSDTTKVTVADGVVTAVAVGTATITATTVDSGKTATCTVTVIEEIEMVSISAGTFSMGQVNIATPVHSVTLTSGFYMGKYQVTQEQYQAVMGTNPSNFNGSTGKEPAAEETQGKRPVEQVSWYDALVFCNKLSIKEGLTPAFSISGKTDPSEWGTVPTSSNDTWNAVVIVSGSTGYRLPTEAQWEYACRAGTTTAYNTGDTINDNTGWYEDNSGSKTHQVGLKPANVWGLYDMHGNVWEWCWDRNENYSSGAQTDPMGASSGSSRVLRGGGWNGSEGNLRSAFRINFIPYYRVLSLGFRLVRP